MGNLVFQATLGGQVNLVGPNTASTYNLNVPAVSSTIATTSGTETLTNKTLTSPVISGGTIDNAVIGGTTAAAGSFTSVSTTGNITLNNGAADGAQLSLASSGYSNWNIDNYSGNFRWYYNTTEYMRLDNSGNLGLGVTPSAWSVGASASVFQVKNASLYGDGSSFALSSNTYYNGGWKYINASSFASGRYEIGGGTHAWYIAPAGTAGNAITFTQVMTLNASGYLGIGQTSPNQPLSVYGADGSNNVALFTRSGGANMYFYADTGANVGFFTGSNAGGSGVYANGTNNTIQFNTNGSERARIDSSGNLLVGTTTLGNAGWSFYGSSTLGASISKTNGTTTFTHIEIKNGNGTVGSIQSSGSTTSYNTSSDYRLKENIQPMTGALAKVAALKPCTYTWKSDGSAGEGFIAHELQAVVPDAVTGEKDAVNEDGSIKPQGIDTSFLVATLTAAIQELKAELDAAKARITALEA